MCGICGFIQDSHQAPFAPGRLETMNDALAHRGPDDAGTWQQGHVGLGQRRLSIVDTSAAGHQPMIHPDGQSVLVYNGELYNHQELRTTLEQRGCEFSSRCDTEVVLYALAEWGVDAFERFNGMFALAWYDLRKDRLILARDRMGIKPLFYTRRNACLAFASELNALKAGDFAETKLNPLALDQYLQYLYIPAPDTIYEDVHKLEPGHYLEWHRGTVTDHQWWRLAYGPRAHWTLAEAATRFQELFRDAVQLRTMADVPLGAFLSGGMDSTAVVATLNEVLDQPVQTFSIGFGDAEANELPFARTAAEHFGCIHHEAMLDPMAVLDLPGIASHFGEPFADSSALPTWLVSELARKEVKVVLSGDGGDELFGGYTWMHMTHHLNRFAAMPKWVRTTMGMGLSLLSNSPRIEKVQRAYAQLNLPPAERFRSRLTCWPDEERNTLYTSDLREDLVNTTTDRFLNHYEKIQDLGHDHAMLWTDTHMYLPDDILTKVDRMTMAHGLEARVPLLDHRIVEFAATLPFNLKYDGTTSKRVLKEAYKNIFPPALLQQRKRGFALPIHRWCRDAWAPIIRDTLCTPNAKYTRYLDQSQVEACIQQHQSGTVDHGHRIWTLLMLELWLQGQSID